MAGLEPLTPQDVPFRKIRNAINMLVSRINQQRPITDGTVELYPNGFRVKGSSGAQSGYVPPFSPQVTLSGTSSSLKVTPGWFHAPKAQYAYGEIAEHMYYPWMPTLGGAALNAAEPGNIGLTNNATNYIELFVTLAERETPVGDSEAKTTVYTGSPSYSGELGVTVNIPDIGVEDSNGDNFTVTPEAYVLLNHIDYDVDTAPEFVKNVTSWTVDTESSIYLPWGKYVMGSDGVVESSEWYWTGHRQMSPPNYTVGGDGTGWNNPGGNAGGDDTSANPIANTNTAPSV